MNASEKKIKKRKTASALPNQYFRLLCVCNTPLVFTLAFDFSFTADKTEIKILLGFSQYHRSIGCINCSQKHI